MGRQRNMTLMKEKNKALEKRTKRNGDRQTTNCRFKTLFKEMLSELRERVGELKVNFNKEIKTVKVGIENIKNNKSKMKTIITEMKNTLGVINSRLHWMKQRVESLI